MQNTLQRNNLQLLLYFDQNVLKSNKLAQSLSQASNDRIPAVVEYLKFLEGVNFQDMIANEETSLRIFASVQEIADLLLQLQQQI